MPNRTPNCDPARAMEDVRGHSLEMLPCEFAKLVCLSSTRDYNTGLYIHEGMSWRYTDEVIDTALRTLHNEVFDVLVVASLETFVQDLDTFFGLTIAGQTTAVEVWKNLEPYRAAIPAHSDSLSRELFFSNVRTALAILENRQRRCSQDQQSSSQRP